MPRDLLEAMPTFLIINPIYFYSRNSWINPLKFLMLTSIAKCFLFFFEKAFCFEFLKYLIETDFFFLCCSNDVELNMSIVKFEFTRFGAFTMTWQSSFYRDTKTNYGREESDLKFMMTHSTIANVWILMVSAR